MTYSVEANDLVIGYRSGGGTIVALDEVNLELEEGSILGVVGESGSGKSTLGFSLARLLPEASVRIKGDLRVLGRDIFTCSPRELRELRRHEISFVFQNPHSSLDPTMRVGRQLREVLNGNSKAPDIERLLTQVGLEQTKRVVGSYPHQLSGGMAQRVAIAMALATSPKIIVADEPTASLDVRLRDQIIELLIDTCVQSNATLILLTHDLYLVDRYCQSIAVMYGGHIVEKGDAKSVLSLPEHPYTRALVDAIPGKEGVGGRLKSIPGNPPVLRGQSAGCAFAPRCADAQMICSQSRPDSKIVEDRTVACHFARTASGG